MANDTLKSVARVIRDLLGVDEQLIRFGRENFPRDDFDDQYIVVDNLGASKQMSNIEVYDGDGEVMSHGGVWREPVTVDFFADSAYNRAIEFSIKLRSQAATELMQDNGIVIYHPKAPVDLRDLTGQQYCERVQIEMMVEISRDVDIDTLRINTAQLNISNEDGEQYNG